MDLSNEIHPRVGVGLAEIEKTVFSPDGTALFMTVDEAGKVQLWDGMTGERRVTIADKNYPYYTVFSPNSHQVLTVDRQNYADRVVEDRTRN